MIVTKKIMQEVEVIAYIICDKCEKEIKTDNFDAFSCELKYRTGKDFPEGSTGELTRMELCEDCADDLIELLKKHNYKVITEIL